MAFIIIRPTANETTRWSFVHGPLSGSSKTWYQNWNKIIYSKSEQAKIPFASDLFILCSIIAECS